MEDNLDSHPHLSEEANNYPTLQLTRSNEKYANERQLRFENELTNLEVQHDGPSTYWKNEPLEQLMPVFFQPILGSRRQDAKPSAGTRRR